MGFLNSISKRFTFTDLIKEAFVVGCGYILMLISYITKRDKSKWVFGNKQLFKDNTKYLFLYVLKHNKELRPIWITSSKKTAAELKSYNYPAYYKYSIRGLYHCLTAGVYVSTVNSNHINYFTSGRAFNVYLWHGIALKSMPDAKSMPWDKTLLSRICMPYAYEKIDFFLSTTPMIDEQFMLTFNLRQDALHSGMYPRNLFMMNDHKVLLKYIEKYEKPLLIDIINKISNYSRTYFYMPTWRLNYGKNFMEYAMPDLTALNQVLKDNDSFLLLKLHPSMKYDVFKNQCLENIFYIEPEVDPYPILPFTDVLISDYSSIYYDYLLLDNKGVILYDFDVDYYVNNEFRFFKDYNEYTPGVHIHDFKSLLNAFASKDSFVLNEEKRSWILNEMWGDNYMTKNNSNLIASIKNKYNC